MLTVNCLTHCNYCKNVAHSEGYFERLLVHTRKNFILPFTNTPQNEIDPFIYLRLMQFGDNKNEPDKVTVENKNYI